MRVVRVYHAGRDASHRERDRALVRAGVEVTLVVPSRWPGPDAVTGEPFDVVPLPVRRAGDVNRHTYVRPERVAELVARLRPDVLDLHEEPFSSVVHQLLRVVPPDLPVVTYAAQNLDKRFPLPFDRWERTALARIHGLYPCSRQAAAVAVGKGFTGRVRVLPLPPAAAFTPGDQRLPVDPVRLLLVGRLVPEKGVRDAVRAAAGASGSRPVELTVVGEGPEREPAEALARQLGVPLRVLPWTDASTLAELYRQAHVLLAPSRTTATWVEQFGRMVTEAWACGAVVVAYDSGALPEVVGRAGVLVPTGDVAALTRAVAGVIADPQRWQRLRHAGSAAAAGTNWDAVAAGQRALYEQAREPRSYLPVRPSRTAARDLWGSAATAGGQSRPFALPVLRDRPGFAAPVARAVDALARRDRPLRQPLRVVYLDHVARLSGGEIALARLIGAVPQVRAHVILAEDGPLVPVLRDAGATVEVLELDPATRDLRRQELGGARAAATVAGYVARLRRRLRELDPDVVHTNSLKSGYYGALAARSVRRPVLWHLRDRLSSDYLPETAARATRAVLATLPDLVVANSRETRRTAGTHARSMVLHDPYAPSRPPRTEYGPLTTVGIVGRLAQWKGQDVVLRALALRRADGRRLQLRIIGSALFGEDAYAARLAELAEVLGIADDVTFVGQVTDVEAELARLDVLVHASRTPEPFGQVIVEGMAAGLPVVATAAGGPAEILTEGVDGLLVPADDPAALAAALGRLDDAGLRAELGRAAVLGARRFGPDRIGAQFAAVYADLARQRRGRRLPEQAAGRAP